VFEALAQKNNSDLPIRSFLNQITSWKFDKEWNKADIDAIEEPWKG